MNARYIIAILSTVSDISPVCVDLRTRFEVRAWLESDAVRHVVRTYPQHAAYAMALVECLASANRRARSSDDDERLAALSIAQETGRKLARFRRMAEGQFAFDLEAA